MLTLLLVAGYARAAAALDLTQADLARQVGCAVITIQKIEADERRPSRLLAERLAASLRITADERAEVITLARAEPYHDSALAAAPQPLCVPQRLPTTLPTPLTSLIGRKQDSAAVRSALMRGETRLLTLIGPPGIGKTRLSIEVAREVHASLQQWRLLHCAGATWRSSARDGNDCTDVGGQGERWSAAARPAEDRAAYATLVIGAG